MTTSPKQNTLLPLYLMFMMILTFVACHLVQVVRYSALVSGVFYGIFHRQTLQAKFDSTQAANEVHKREEWLKQAKEAWAAKTAKNDGRKLDCDPTAPAVPFPFPSLPSGSPALCSVCSAGHVLRSLDCVPFGRIKRAREFR